MCLWMCDAETGGGEEEAEEEEEAAAAADVWEIETILERENTRKRKKTPFGVGTSPFRGRRKVFPDTRNQNRSKAEKILGRSGKNTGAQRKKFSKQKKYRFGSGKNP